MPVQVMVLEESSSEPLSQWRMGEGSLLSREKWREVASRLAEERDGEGEPEVYFCFLGEQFEKYDHRLIQRLSGVAREHIPDAQLYAVVDGRRTILENPIDRYDSLQRWFDTAHASGIKDLLEVSIGLTDLDQVDTTILRRACDRSLMRERLLATIDPRGPWRIFLAEDKGDRLADLLDPYMHYEGLPVAFNLVVAVTDHHAVKQRDFVQEVRERLPAETLLVATIDVWPERPLRDYCRMQELNLIRLRGWLELRYFVTKANRTAGLSSSPPAALDSIAKFLPSSPRSAGQPATVFISYSHEDEAWKNRLKRQLDVLRAQGLLDVWEDRIIPGGEDWKPRIDEALRQAKLAILLISAHFLTSEFILENEIPLLLKRRDEDGLRILPVIVSECLWKKVAWLSRLAVRPPDGRPLSAGTEPQIDADLADIAGEVLKLL